MNYLITLTSNQSYVVWEETDNYEGREPNQETRLYIHAASSQEEAENIIRFMEKIVPSTLDSQYLLAGFEQTSIIATYAYLTSFNAFQLHNPHQLGRRNLFTSSQIANHSSTPDQPFKYRH